MTVELDASKHGENKTGTFVLLVESHNRKGSCRALVARGAASSSKRLLIKHVLNCLTGKT